MSEYNYRAYSPSKSNQSPTRRHPIIPPAGTVPPRAGYGDGFEGWYDGSLSYTNPPPPSDPLASHNIPPSLQPARGSSSSRRGDYDRDADLAFGSEPTKRASRQYATGIPDRGRDSDFRRRGVRTPSTSSTESIPRRSSRSSRSSRRERERTPSISPSRPIGVTSRSGGTQRTPSGNIMNSLFTSENAAAVGSVLGAAASFVGSKAGIIKQDIQDEDHGYTGTPGGFNSRPVPDTVNQGDGGFNLNNAVEYLRPLMGQQNPPPPPPQQQPAGSPFTLSNALNYLQQQSGQPPANGATPGGLPQGFRLAGIDIDFNWIAQKAGEQNPWVLLGGGVVAFWIISSIIATLMWYGIIAGILYAVYIVGIKNGGFNAISGSPDRRRVGGGGGTGAGTGRPGANTPRRRY